ncbi:MAG: NRDE family protein [Opitutaceae bacterium]
MCTVSWEYSESGYVVFFNRDEMRTRRPATGPEERIRGGVRFLAPTDGEQGGTWISVNEFGLTLGLLNHYPTGCRVAPGDRPSRGHLVHNLSDSGGCGDVAKEMSRMDMRPYPPFRLFGIDRVGSLLLNWDGVRLRSTETEGLFPPVTSSSWQTAAVERYRIGLFESSVRSSGGGINRLERYHHEHSSDRPAESVLMCRPDACTHSVVRIDLGQTRVSMRYEPQPWIEQPMAMVNASLALRS